MDKQQPPARCDKCTSCKSKFKLMSVPRNRENGCFAYANISMDLIKPICYLLLEGAYVDKLSSLLNQKILKHIIDECKLSLDTIPESNSKQPCLIRAVCKIVTEESEADEDNNNNVKSLSATGAVLKININRLLETIKAAGLDFCAPFHLLDGDLVHKNIDKERATQLDIHERILFQTLQLWNTINSKDRQRIVVKTFQMQYPDADKDTVSYIRRISAIEKETMFNVLMRARGLYLKNNPATTHREHGPNNTFISNFKNVRFGANSNTLSPFCVVNPCPCAGDFFMTRLCKRFDDVIDAKQGTNDEVVTAYDIEDFKDCKRFSKAIVQSIFSLWTGVATLDLVGEDNKILSFKKIDINADFFVTSSEHSLIKSLSALNDRGELLLRCNHEGIKRHVFRIFYYSNAYCSIDSIVNNEQMTVKLRPHFEDIHFNILAPEEIIMNNRLAELQSAYNTALINQQFTIALSNLLSSQFSPVIKFKTLKEKVTWVMFEMIYRRNCDVFPTVSSEYLTNLNPETERYMLTFGLVTDLDTRWKENDDTVEQTILHWQVLVRLFKSQLRYEIVNDHDMIENKKLKKQQKRAKKKKDRKAQQQQQQQQQQQESEEEDEDEEEEDEEVKENAICEQSQSTHNDDENITLTFTKTFVSVIGQERREKLRRQDKEEFDREFSRLIDKCTFYYQCK